jgi:hypothetical protein
VNPNAPQQNMPLLQNATYPTQANNPFQIEPAALPVSYNNNGLPQFEVLMGGITDNLSPNFQIDMTSGKILAWGSTCQHTQMGNYQAGPCSSAPTYTNSSFNGGTNKLDNAGNFTNSTFGGYTVSGVRYFTQICTVNTKQCKDAMVYQGDVISTNKQMWNQPGLYGIMGMSPSSPFWNGYINPTTYTAQYTISLQRPTLLGGIEGASSNSAINIGEGADSSYLGTTNMTANSSSGHHLTYPLASIGFGLIYYDNGTATSQYYRYFDESAYNVDFTLNVLGMGLPTSMYNEMQELLADTIEDYSVSCGDLPETQTYCVLPQSCNNYQQF